MNNEKILYYLGILENGALNYYQTVETIRIASQSIQNYIEQLEQQCKKQKEVIDRILNETKETRNILNNNRYDNMLSKGCLLSYLEIVEDLLKEVSE